MRPPSHHELVENLIADADPVRPLPPPGRRLDAWLVLSLGAVLTVVALLLHVRPDVTTAIVTGPFLCAVGSSLAAAWAVAWLALRAAIPGEEPGRREMRFAIVLSVAAILVVLLAPARTPASLASFVGIGLRCLLGTLMLAAVPWAALLLALRRGAPVTPGRAGALAGAAAFLMAAAGMRFVCSIDEAFHLLAWHTAPIAAGAGVSALVGAAWLGRWSRV